MAQVTIPQKDRVQVLKIRAAIKDKGLTQAKAAECIDMPPSQLSLILNNKRSLRVGAFKRLCHLLDLDPREVW